MELIDIETMENIISYSNEKEFENNENDVVFKAKIFSEKKKINELYFDFWNTQMSKHGRNQLPSTDSQYIYLFKIVKKDQKLVSVGIVFPLDFDTTVSKVVEDNEKITFYLKSEAFYFSYNRKFKKYTSNKIKNHKEYDFDSSTHVITLIMDSQSPDHPKTQISGAVWG